MATMEQGPSRSLDLGFLDSLDLPEFQLDGNALKEEEEMYPVDAFFEKYIETLEGQAGAMSRMDTGDGTLLPLPQSLALPQAQLPQTNGIAATVPLDNGLLSGQAPFTDALNGQPTSASVSTTMPLPLPQDSTPISSAPAPALAMPDIPTTSAASVEEAPRGSRSGRGGTRAGRGGSSAQRDDGLHELHEKTKRNPKQQLQNKQAQQRYRERRKQRFNELETALGQLNEQMNAKQFEVAGLQSQNAALQGKTQELADVLAAREAELAQLKHQLAAASVAGGPASSDGHSTGTGHSGGGAHGDTEAGTARTASGGHGHLSATELQQSRSEYAALVATMREIADGHSLRHVNPLGEGVVPEVLEQVRTLVSAGCNASQALDRKGGIAVLEVMGRDVEAMGTPHTCSEERRRWGQIVETLRLAPRQEEALLALRKQHLARLKAVYQARQSLNMQAMGMMLPSPARADVASRMTGGDPTLEGKMACMSIGSYLNCARNTLALDGVLDALKDNLREEQKTFMEMKLVTLHRVLSPIQTLLFVVEAYPVRPDALALANAVALRLGRATEGCPKAAELLRAAEEEAQRGSSGTQPSSGSAKRAGSMSDDSHKSDCCSLSPSKQ